MKELHTGSLGEKLGVRCKDKVEMLEVRRWLKTLRVTQS